MSRLLREGDRILRRRRQGFPLARVATVAVGHSILIIVYHVLQNRTSYQELGGDYVDRRMVDKQRKRLIRQLESLGVKVTIEEVKEAA